MVGSGLFQLLDIGNDPVPPAWGPIALATVVAFFIGYAVIAWLLRYISTHNFLPFVIYRLALAGARCGAAADRCAGAAAARLTQSRLIAPWPRSVRSAGATTGDQVRKTRTLVGLRHAVSAASFSSRCRRRGRPTAW